MGCSVEEIKASPLGHWLISKRLSGQGEWGYEVFSTCPLKSRGGILEEKGYMLEMPLFSKDESFILGVYGEHFLGGWWNSKAYFEEPADGGEVVLGYIFIHSLISQKVKQHELRINLPKGWIPDNIDSPAWHGAEEINLKKNSVEFKMTGNIRVNLEFPLKEVIYLPTPHPLGNGLILKDL